MNFTLIKILILASLLLLILNFIPACSTQVKNLSLPDETFLAKIQGTYRSSLELIQQINSPNTYFTNIPSPLFSQLDLFVIPSSGTINLNNSNNSSQIILAFESTVANDNNSAIFTIFRPSLNEAGYLIKNNRFTKLSFTSNTNLLYSGIFSASHQEAESHIATIPFATFLAN